MSQSPCNDIDTCRSIWNIAYNCFATIFICTWVALRPNVPAYGASRGNIFFSRFKLMLVALIFPDIILLWAIEQRYAASEIVDDMRNKGNLSLTQGFFLTMGGYVMKAGKSDTYRPIYLKGIGDAESQNEYQLCGDVNDRLRDLDIEDKSKADTFANFVAVVQLLWFLIQCTNRFIARLPLTKLEVVTISLALLNIIIYWVWRDKPTKVDRPFVVLCSPGDKGDRAESVAHANVQIAKEVQANNVWLIDWFHTLVYFFFYVPTVGRTTMEVPMFWTRISKRRSRNAFAWASVSAVFYGAIHFIAWDYSAPSHIEAWWWRISCCIVFGSPVFYLACFVALAFKAPDLVRHFIQGCSAMVVPIYCFARISALGLAVVSLRALPPSAFQTSTWLNALLHFT